MNQDFRYGRADGSESLRTLLVNFIDTYFLIPKDRLIDKCMIATTPGIYGALDQIFCVVANPGDGIMIGRPMYDGFIRGFTFSRSKVQVIPVDFKGDSDEKHVDPFSEAAICRYRNAFKRFKDNGTNVKALVICNPHNPLGRCFVYLFFLTSLSLIP